MSLNGNPMSGRMESLKARHAELERLIDEEHKRPNPNDVQIGTMKKEKLRLKEEMGALRAVH